jgi:hypothetical protein
MVCKAGQHAVLKRTHWQLLLPLRAAELSSPYRASAHAPACSTAPAAPPANTRLPTCLPAPGLQVSLLRSQLEAKGKQLTGLQADMQALQGDAEARLGGCEKQLLAYKERCSVLKQEAEAKRERSAKASRPAI